MRADDATSLCVNLAGSGASAMGGAAPSSVDVRSFRFEAVLSPTVTQADVMTKCGVRHLLDSVLVGHTATVLAYGQTGSGKTFTMSGLEDPDAELSGELDETGLAKDDGLILRSLAHLYARMAQATSGGDAAPRFRVKASYLEIYNEAVYDLLDPGEPPQLAVRWDGTAFHVPQARRVACDTLDTALRVIAVGARNRRVGSHELNKDSSRSHAICTLFVEAARPGAATVTCGKISFVDLAGSERLKASKSAGVMMTETGSINRSLMALGKVISALSENGGRAGCAHIPYRDSKLTKLLMDSLGGGSLALMVACCSPAAGAVEETLSTLTYATRAKNIVNAPVVSHGAAGGASGEGAVHSEALRRELEALRAENASLRLALATAGTETGALGGVRLSGTGRFSQVTAGTDAPAMGRLSGTGRFSGTGLTGLMTERRVSDLSAYSARSSLMMTRSPSPRRWRASGVEEGDGGPYAGLSREALMARLEEVQGSLAGASAAAAEATAENESLRAAKEALATEHAARSAEAAALTAKLRDLEAVFLETPDGSDGFPVAAQPLRAGSAGASGEAAPSAASHHAARTSQASCGDADEEAYYRTRTAPCHVSIQCGLDGTVRAQAPAQAPATTPEATEPCDASTQCDPDDAAPSAPPPPPRISAPVSVAAQEQALTERAVSEPQHPPLQSAAKDAEQSSADAGTQYEPLDEPAAPLPAASLIPATAQLSAAPAGPAEEEDEEEAELAHTSEFVGE